MPRADLPTLWKSKGLCEGKQRLFYSPNYDDEEAAKRICRDCEVRLPCRAFALLNREEYGVWGGTAEGERRRMLTLSLALNVDFEELQMRILRQEPEPTSTVTVLRFEFRVPKIRFDFGTSASA